MEFDHRPYVAQAKRALREQGDPAAAFAAVSDTLAREVAVVADAAARGASVIPEISYGDVAAGAVPDAARDAIRRRGCAIIRGVFPRSQAEAWNDELGAYIETNDYVARAKEKAGLDSYFGGLDAAAPQIFGLYWSRPQVMARQAESMAATKRFLNRLYRTDAPMGPEFDPDHDYAYADRTRRRRPGDKTLGLSPHMDSGSYERWVDPVYQRIYAPIFAGQLDAYNPWNAAFRTQTREFSSPAVCSMFRSFQGWTALTTQGPSDGTLSLIPIANGIAYLLLRALQDDVAEDDLCGAMPGRALGVTPQWHGDLLAALVSIPTVEPGDTVWWHPDIVHAVAGEHTGAEFANVIYIGATPRCAKNEAYARRQAAAFLAGQSAPDFAPEDYEVSFEGRATPEDLTPLGRDQMCLG